VHNIRVLESENPYSTVGQSGTDDGSFLCVGLPFFVGRDSVVGIATCCELDSLGIETVRSKAEVCRRSIAGIAGSNPPGGMDGCVVCCRKIHNTMTKNTKVHNG
jgi:hypothetical protein